MFLDVPLGHTTGGPNDPETQRAILQAGLQAGFGAGPDDETAMTEPGTIVDLPWRWRDDDWKTDPLSWSRRRQDSGQSGSPSGSDTRTARSDQPRYQSEADQAAAEAVSFDDQCRVCLGIS